MAILPRRMTGDPSHPISPYHMSGLTTPFSAAKMRWSFTALRRWKTCWADMSERGSETYGRQATTFADD